MISGVWVHTLNEKGRVVIPLPVRQALGATFVLVPARSPGGEVLLALSRPEWEALKAENAHSYHWWETVGSLAYDVQPNPDGRIVIPHPLRERFGLVPWDSVVIRGMGIAAELLPEARWAERQRQEQPT